jgi:hypothetical protein
MRGFGIVPLIMFDCIAISWLLSAVINKSFSFYKQITPNRSGRALELYGVLPYYSNRVTFGMVL